MRSVEKEARTVDEAVALALEELGIDMDRAEVEVIEEGSKGLFGLLGVRHAKVKVTAIETIDHKIEAGVAFLSGLLEHMGIEAHIERRVTEDNIVHMHVRGRKLGAFIGRRGQTLDAVQYLVNLIANREEGPRARIVVDAEGYREKRAETLTELAERFARRAKTEGRRMALDPMSALERRVIHMALAHDDGIVTSSEGEEPYRRVIISPKRK